MGLPPSGGKHKSLVSQVSEVSRRLKNNCTTLHNISYQASSGEHIQASPELIDTGSSMAATDPAADIKSQLALCSATCLRHFGRPRGHFEIDTNSIQFHPILSILACEIPQLPKDVWWLAWPIAAWMRQGLRPSWLAARRGESQITCNCRAALACGRMWRTADEKG